VPRAAAIAYNGRLQACLTRLLAVANGIQTSRSRHRPLPFDQDLPTEEVYTRKWLLGSAVPAFTQISRSNLQLAIRVLFDVPDLGCLSLP